MRCLPLLSVLLIACEGPQGPPPAKVGTPQEVHDTSLMGLNKRIAEREALDIERWIGRQGVPLEGSGTGLRYKLVRDVAGATAKPGQYAAVRYTLLLLSGDTAYTSGPEPERFLIEEDDVESGLHEGIQFLSPGDSAVLVIPSHLAHGLLGDQDRIPPRSTVVYHIVLDELR